MADLTARPRRSRKICTVRASSNRWSVCLRGAGKAATAALPCVSTAQNFEGYYSAEVTAAAELVFQTDDFPEARHRLAEFGERFAKTVVCLSAGFEDTMASDEPAGKIPAAVND